jgi:hypothetical protein
VIQKTNPSLFFLVFFVLILAGLFARRFGPWFGRLVFIALCSAPLATCAVFYFKYRHLLG